MRRCFPLVFLALFGLAAPASVDAALPQKKSAVPHKKASAPKRSFGKFGKKAALTKACAPARLTPGQGGAGNTVTVDYKALDDECGILFWLGSDRRKSGFANPADAGVVAVDVSSLSADSAPTSALVGRDLVRLTTKPAARSWMQVDFRQYRVVARRYTLRHYSSWDTEALRNWKLQASNDAQTWTTLRTHVNDTALDQKGERATWTLSGTEAVKPWRYFRVQQTGKNSNNHYYLALSGLELYGDLVDTGNPGGIKSGRFIYKTEFDTNGVVHHIGSNGGKRQFQNPGDGAMAVFASSVMTDSAAPTELLARKTLRFSSKPKPGEWIVFDFLHRRVRPTHYSLRHYTTWDTEALRNWVLEASNDAKTWTVLREHVKDSTLDQKGEAATWDLPAAPAGARYRYFRIRMTGKNSNNHHYLTLSGFEIYGDLDE